MESWTGTVGVEHVATVRRAAGKKRERCVALRTEVEAGPDVVDGTAVLQLLLQLVLGLVERFL
jgi:hypothetical protein